MRASVGERARSQRGFTMIEVMIALLLAAIAVVGILALYLSATRSSGFSRHSTEAAVLAQDEIEKLRTQVPAVSIPYPGLVENNLNERGVTPGVFKRTTIVNAGTSLVTIKVTVEWNDDNQHHLLTINATREP